jgi:hypothetical protein
VEWAGDLQNVPENPDSVTSSVTVAKNHQRGKNREAQCQILRATHWTAAEIHDGLNPSVFQTLFNFSPVNFSLP